MMKTENRMCMHCERPFVFHDEMRYFAHKRLHSLPCDICEEMNYMVKTKDKPVLLLGSIIAGIIFLLPLLGCLWFVYSIWMSEERIRIFVLSAVLFVGFTITSASVNMIFRNYIWQTHKFSKRFESPFLDNLKR